MRKVMVSRLTIIVVMTLLGVAVILTGCDIELPEDRWASFHNDAANGGYSLSDGVDKGNAIWTFSTAGAVTSSPAYRYEKVFITDNTGVVYCLEKKSENGQGKQLWKYPSDGSSIGNELTSVAVVGHTVFVGSDDGHVYAINEKTGDLKWQYPLSQDQPLQAIYSSPTVAYDKVFVGCDDGNLYVLNEDDGTLETSVATGGPIRTTPAAKFSRIYFGSEDGRMYCWDEDDEELLWQYPSAAEAALAAIHSSPAVGGDEVYFGCDNGRLYCVDEDDGKLFWDRPAGDQPIYSSPALGHGQVFVGSDSGRVFAFKDDDDGGELMWQYPIAAESPKAPFRSSPAIADHIVYIVSQDGNLYAFDEDWDDERLIFPPVNLGGSGETFVSSPAIASKRLFVGTNSGITVFKD